MSGDESRPTNSPDHMFGSLDRNDLQDERVSAKGRKGRPTLQHKQSRTAIGKRGGTTLPDYPKEEGELFIPQKKKSLEEILAEEEAQMKHRRDRCKANAEIHKKAGNLKTASSWYTKALEIDPKHVECFILRASCYFELKNYKKTIDDANAALKIDHTLTKAVGLKAESQYMTGKFEAALVSFHRARRQRPGIRSYTQGVDRAKQAIEGAIGESAGVKLTLRGDLSHFEQFIEGKYRENSAYKRATKVDREKHSAKSIKSAKDRHDPKTVKQLLQELYGDYEYLEQILSEEEKHLQKIEHLEKAKTEKEKQNVDEQTPQIKGRRQQQNDPNADFYQNETISDKQKYIRRNISSGIKNVVSKELDFLHQRTDFYRQLKPPTGNPRYENPDEDERSDSATSLASVFTADELIELMEQIEADHADCKYNLALRKCEKALDFIRRQMYSDLPNRDEFEATIYSFMGNAYFELEDYPSALEHHKRDLELAKKLDIQEAFSRALDNIGRTYSRMGKFDAAISIFEEKLDIAKEPLEATWLHHELGRCYFEKGEFEKALEYADKSFSAAEEVDDNAWKLNATVLKAQTYESSGHYEEAHESFERALELARSERDRDAQDALTKAMRGLKYKQENGGKAEDEQQSDRQHEDDKDEFEHESTDLRDQMKDENQEENIRDTDDPDKDKQQEEQDLAAQIMKDIKESNQDEEDNEDEDAENIRDTIKKSNKKSQKNPKGIAKQIKKSNAKYEKKDQKEIASKIKTSNNLKPKPEQPKPIQSTLKTLDKSPYRSPRHTKKTSPAKKVKREERDEPEDDSQEENTSNNTDVSNNDQDVSNKTNEQSEESNSVQDNIDQSTEAQAQHQPETNGGEEDAEENKTNESRLHEDTENTKSDEVDNEMSQRDIRDMIQSTNKETEEKQEDSNKNKTENDDFFD